MARSVLLQLARDSITEVFEAKRHIQKEQLQKEHPLLREPLNVTLTLYRDEKIIGNFTTSKNDSLLENIILSAKKAAFEDKGSEILTTSKYLHCQVEVTLHTADGVMKERDEAILLDD